MSWKISKIKIIYRSIVLLLYLSFYLYIILSFNNFIIVVCFLNLSIILLFYLSFCLPFCCSKVSIILSVSVFCLVFFLSFILSSTVNNFIHHSIYCSIVLFLCTIILSVSRYFDSSFILSICLILNLFQFYFNLTSLSWNSNSICARRRKSCELASIFGFLSQISHILKTWKADEHQSCRVCLVFGSVFPEIKATGAPCTIWGRNPLLIAWPLTKSIWDLIESINALVAACTVQSQRLCYRLLVLQVKGI